MASEPTGRVVDADGHVLEPADTWLKYLDPSYRDRAIRIDTDPEGYEVLLIDGRPLKTLRGQLGSLGGIDMDAARLLTMGQVTYAEGSPPGGLHSAYVTCPLVSKRAASISMPPSEPSCPRRVLRGRPSISSTS